MASPYDKPLEVPTETPVAVPVPTPALQEEKPKRVVNEAQLRALAAGRKKQMETRAAAKKAAAEEEAAKQQAPPPPSPEEVSEEEEAEEEEEEPVPPPKKPTKRPKQEKTERLIDWAQKEYYEIKLQKLKQKMEEEEALARYKTAPTQQHMADVAKHELRKKLDAEAMNRAYTQLFGEAYSLMA